MNWTLAETGKAMLMIAGVIFGAMAISGIVALLALIFSVFRQKSPASYTRTMPKVSDPSKKVRENFWKDRIRLGRD